jgi:hypothetical protein
MAAKGAAAAAKNITFAVVSRRYFAPGWPGKHHHICVTHGPGASFGSLKDALKE